MTTNFIINYGWRSQSIIQGVSESREAAIAKCAELNSGALAFGKYYVSEFVIGEYLTDLNPMKVTVPSYSHFGLAYRTWDEYHEALAEADKSEADFAEERADYAVRVSE